LGTQLHHLIFLFGVENYITITAVGYQFSFITVLQIFPINFYNLSYLYLELYLSCLQAFCSLPLHYKFVFLTTSGFLSFHISWIICFVCPIPLI